MRSRGRSLGFVVVLVAAATLALVADPATARSNDCDNGLALEGTEQVAHAYDANETDPPNKSEAWFDHTTNERHGRHGNLEDADNITNGSPLYVGDDCMRVNVDADGESVLLNDSSLDSTNSDDHAWVAVLNPNNVASGEFYIRKKAGDNNVDLATGDTDGTDIKWSIQDDQGDIHSRTFDTANIGDGTVFDEGEFTIFMGRYTAANDTAEFAFAQEDQDSNIENLTHVGSFTAPSVGDNQDLRISRNQLLASPDIGGLVYYFSFHNNNTDFSRLHDIALKPYHSGFKADFGFSCSGLTCDFTDQSTTGPDDFIQERNWTFGDGTQNKGNNATDPTHTYDDFGTFTVTLTATNSTGDTSTTSHEVDVRLEPEFNTSAGLVGDSTLRTIAASWSKQAPTIWGRDTRQNTNPDDGTLVQWNETLSHTDTHNLCPDSDFNREETNTGRGLAVSKDPGSGNPLNECATGDDLQRAVLVRSSSGDALFTYSLGSETGGGELDISARTLNNVTHTVGNERGLFDAQDLAFQWEVTNGPNHEKAHIDWDPTQGSVSCFTGIDGTRCRDADGFVIGKDGTLFGNDLALVNGTVHVLTNEEDIQRFNTNMNLINSTPLTAGEFEPLEISKTGRFVAHKDGGGGLTDLNSIIVRHADNGSKVVETSRDLTGVRDLSWHPRDERLYAANASRIVAYNLTGVLNSSDATETEDTTTGAEPDEPEPVEKNPFGIDTDAFAEALGVSPATGATFAGIILVLGMSTAGAVGFLQHGAGSTGAVFGAFLAGTFGLVLAQLLGWIPMWALFLVLVALLAVIAQQMGLLGRHGD